MGAATAEGNYCATGGIQIRKKQEPGVFGGEVGHRMEYSLGDESQRPLGPDQQVLKNIDRPFEINKGIERISGCVLHAVLATDTLVERRICVDFSLQLQKAV